MLDAKLLANKGVKRLKSTLDTVELLSSRIVCVRNGRYITEVTMRNGENTRKFRTSRPTRWGRHAPSREEAITDLLFVCLAHPDGNFSYGPPTKTFWGDFLGWPSYDLTWHKMAYEKMNRKEFCELLLTA